MAPKSVRPSKASNPVTITEYVRLFIWRLNREFADDETCRRIAADKQFGPECAQILRAYVDPEFRKRWDEDRKAMMEVRRAALVKAVDGLQAGADLVRQRDPEKAKGYHIDATNFLSELAGVDELLNVKRHGRFLDHSILLYARQMMEPALGKVSYESLANLVTAAQLAMGQDDAAPVDAQSLRMNIENFVARNPTWPTANSDP